MVTPTLLQHIAFDATTETNFTFTSVGGNQVVKNRLQILNNSTLAIVYDSTQTTFALVHILPANTLTNGGFYSAKIKTYDINDVESEWSNGILVRCFTAPSFTFNNITPTINTSSKLFEVAYAQIQNEPISQSRFMLYDANGILIQQSEVLYNVDGTLPPNAVSYLFTGMLDGQTYKVRATGTTLNGMALDTEYITFNIVYTEPNIFSTIQITSDCENGVNNILLNLRTLEGVSDPFEPIYIKDNTELDNRDYRNTVTWDSDFETSDKLLFRRWGYQYNPSTIIARLSGDGQEQLVIKYMNDVLDPTPTVAEFNALNLTVDDFNSKLFTPIKFLYKFYQTLGTVTTYKEYVRVEYTSPSGVTTTVDSNQIPLTADDDRVFIWIKYDGANWTVSLENLTDIDTFGIEADMQNNTFTRIANSVGKTAGADFNVVNAFGGRKRCNVTDGGVVLAYYGEAGYTETGALTQNIYIGVQQFLIGTPVQVMVEQPEFYYKVVPIKADRIVGGRGYHLRKARYYVSDVPKDGFKLHPTFLINGVEKDFIYHSAFEGSIYDTSANAYLLADEQVADFNADKLCSIANAKPCSGLTQLLTRPNTRKLAQNRGSGWQQQFVHTTSASQLLFMIEYASFNSQTAIGLGVVSKAFGTGNESEPTGQTSSLGNSSGMASGTNGLVSVTYRGEENIWGNMLKFIDGANCYAYGIHDLYIADNGFADNIGTSPYKNVGITLAKTNGNISAFAYNTEFDYLFYPSETIGTSSLPVGDVFQQSNASTSWFACFSNGHWNEGAYNGMYRYRVDLLSSVRTQTIGARLVYIPQ